MAKILVDFETIGFFKCAKLTETSNLNRIYYNTLNSSACKKFNLIEFNNKKIHLAGLNGINYELEYSSKINYLYIFFEFFLYTTCLSFYIYLKNIVIKHKIKLQALEIEKRFLLDQAMQVTHDVSSPLSAIQLVVGLLKNIDPEIKNILINSVNRTQSIFNELKNSNLKLADVDVPTSLNEIISEKIIVWGYNCFSKINYTTLVNPTIKSNEVEFKRVISNILTNAFESFENNPIKKITIDVYNQNNELHILIADNGKGIANDILSQFGKVKITHGKETRFEAGSGLGVFHAYQNIKTWGGDIIYTSRVNIGTQVKITLPTATPYQHPTSG
jgi:signal transduction histidine kinase